MSRDPIRTAFIPGAGLGKRLRPLTDDCPKPLLPVAGRPMITHAMDHLLTAGIERFIVNTHHRPEAYARAFPDRRWRGVPIVFRHEPVLLDTAGGLKNIEDLLEGEEATLVYNGDILTDLPLRRLLASHAGQGREVTLALRSSGPIPNVELDAGGAVCDMRRLLGRPGVRSCQFTGIYVVERRFLGRLYPGRIESVVPVFAGMIREAPGSVGAVIIDEGFWHDIGDPREYERIRRTFGRGAGKGDVDGDADEIRAVSRHALKLDESDPVRMDPLSRGGSNRAYWRLRCGGERTAVLMRYRSEPAENLLYAAIAAFLQGIGVAVPRIIHHDPVRRLIVMEDLGDRDLWSCRDQSRAVRGECYRKALALIHRLHAFPPADFPSRSVPLTEPFGPDLYRWERDYFREHFVRALCGLDLGGTFADDLEAELSRLAERIEGTGKTLIHRDFQSQNIMIRGGEPVLIDFQGMRFGSFFYDLGSLLYDPYVSFSEEERLALLRDHYGRHEAGLGWPEYRDRFRDASAQRLMQALGAYGFLGLQRGRRDFLAHAAGGLENLIDASTRAANLPALRKLALKCREALSGRRPLPDGPLTG